MSDTCHGICRIIMRYVTGYRSALRSITEDAWVHADTVVRHAQHQLVWFAAGFGV